VAGGTYARTVLGLPYRDLTGGFKCLSATALRAIGLETLTAKGYAFQIETTFRAARAGLRITEIPIAFGERRHGSSKMSPAIAAEALWRMPLIRAATELDARRPATPARRHRPVGP
jgi:dolichol-phosphate mannosyltransferase